jgi:hypothetical protein
MLDKAQYLLVFSKYFSKLSKIDSGKKLLVKPEFTEIGDLHKVIKCKSKR